MAKAKDKEFTVRLRIVGGNAPDLLENVESYMEEHTHKKRPAAVEAILVEFFKNKKAKQKK